MLALLLMVASLLSAQGTEAQLKEIHKQTHAKHEIIEIATENLDPKNRATVEELYDAVMGVNHVVNIPDSVKTALKGPLVNAESAYWSKIKPGIDENDVVKAFNNIVTTLALPDEAKMTLGQFQVIRHGLFVNFNPRFMEKDVPLPDDVIGAAKANPRMSPLQTMHVVMSVMDNKLSDISGRWMITPEEWEKLDKSQFSRPHPPGAKLVMRPGDFRTDNAKQVEIKFRRAMYKMTDLEGLTMLQNALSTLGVI